MSITNHPKSNLISIRTKLIQMQLLLALVILLGSTTAIFFKDVFFFRQSIERNLTSTARILELNLVPALTFSDKAEATNILASLQSEPSIISAYVIDPKGNIFAMYKSADSTLKTDEEQEVITTNHHLKSVLRGSHMLISHPLTQNGELQGYLHLDADLKVFLAEYKIYVWIVLGVLISGLLVAFALAQWIQRSLSIPIMALADTAKNISRSGDYSLRMDNEGTYSQIDEIRTLSNEFNQMLDQIQVKEQKINFEKDVAEKANQTKSIFLANISHELRTPMHGILSFARFGQQKIDTASKEKIKSYFDEIYESGERLMNLLNDLLDLSKLEAGKTVYTMNTADLVEIANVVQAEMSAFAAERGLSISVVAKTRNASVVMDAEKIMQVLRNILSNAIKFSDRGSVICIELEALNHSARCSVINKGIGIPKEEIETIFDKFIQSSKTKTGAGGTGLGLAICKEIIQHHSGKIWVENSSDSKTKFIFEIPESLQATAV